MKRAYIFALLTTLITTGCGVKGAPMPRRDEVFIEKTLIQPEAETAVSEDEKKEDKKDKDKTTILPKKDLR